MMTIALYQPDIPQNLGAMIRLCACMGCGLEVIEPVGFPWDERKIRQSAMDYYEKLRLQRHASWDIFREHHAGRGRIILMTTRADCAYTAYSFQKGDILLAGRESAGVPDSVHEQVDARLGIPMRAGFRSLNIVNATAMILGEALRQIRGQV
jgi:tRNA (cytidine/uridine-2'-O-)-methyltransferase